MIQPPPGGGQTVTFLATHTVPQGGLQTWADPDPASTPNNQLAAGLPVQVLEQRGAWAKVVCDNGWSAWVDGRTLVPPAPAAVVAPAAVSAHAQAPATRAGGRRIGVTQLLTLAGAVAIGISGMFGWYLKLSADIDGTTLIENSATNGFGVPASYLFTNSPGVTATSPFSVGLVVIVIAAMAAISMVVPRLNVVRWLAGAAAAIVAALFANQLLHDSNAAAVTASVGPGAKWCVGGAIAVLVGNSRGGGGPRSHR